MEFENVDWNIALADASWSFLFVLKMLYVIDMNEWNNCDEWHVTCSVLQFPD